MQTYYATVRDSQGDALPNATVTVYMADGVTLAPSIYDETGALQANPLQTNSGGEYAVAAPDGAYIISVQTPGGVSNRNVVLLDASALAAALPIAVASAQSSAAAAESASSTANIYRRYPNYNLNANGAVTDIPNIPTIAPSFGWIEVSADETTLGSPITRYQKVGSTLTNKTLVQTASGTSYTNNRSVAQKFSDVVSLLDFAGSDPSGETDSSSALRLALAASKRIFIPDGLFQIDNVVVPDEIAIEGYGTLIGVNGSNNGMLLLQNTKNNIEVIINTNGSVYGIIDSGVRNRISSQFSGNTGNYIVCNGSIDPQVVGCIFDGSTATAITTPLVFENCDGYLASENRFLDTLGFGLVSRLNAFRGIVSRNKFKQPQYVAQSVATAGQTIFNFSLAKAVSRYGVQINGVPTFTGVSISTSDSQNFSVTVSARLAGDIVKLIGYRSLENIQANSQTYDLQILGNEMDGTGDSGIVLANDYHNGVLNPSQATSADLPQNISVIDGNTVKNAAYAGIADTCGTLGFKEGGNILRDCGVLATGDNPAVSSYRCGVFSTGPKHVGIHSTFENTTSPPTMSFGRNIGAYNVDDGTTDKSTVIGADTFIGNFIAKYYIPNGANPYRKQSVKLIGAPISYYPERINTDSTFSGGAPANTNYFTYSSGGGGVSYDTVFKQGGVGSFTLGAGAELDINPTALSAWAPITGSGSHIMHFSFFAAVKTTGATAQVNIHSQLASVDEVGPTLTISSTSWQRYTLSLPLSNLTNFFIALIATGGNVNFQYFEIYFEQFV